MSGPSRLQSTIVLLTRELTIDGGGFDWEVLRKLLVAFDNLLSLRYGSSMKFILTSSTNLTSLTAGIHGRKPFLLRFWTFYSHDIPKYSYAYTGSLSLSDEMPLSSVLRETILFCFLDSMDVTTSPLSPQYFIPNILKAYAVGWISRQHVQIWRCWHCASQADIRSFWQARVLICMSCFT